MKKIVKYTGVWVRRIVYALSIFLLLLSGFLHSVWFQSAAGRYAGEVCSRWSGHTVSIGSLQFNLFKRAVSVCDLQVSDRQGKEMVMAESVYLAFSNYEFKGVDIAALSVQRPRIYIRKRTADTASDFKLLLQKLGTLKKNKDRRNVTTLRQIRVWEGLFVYEDQTVPMRADGCLDFKHVDVPAFDAHIRNLHIFNKQICARIKHLSAREAGGLDIRHLAAWVGFFPDRLALKDLDLETAHSHLQGDWQFGYGCPAAFRDFAKAVRMQGHIAADSRLATQDLGYFVPAMQAYHQTVTFAVCVSGPLKDLDVRGLKLSFGRKSHLAAGLYWRNAPALTGSRIDLDLTDLYVDRQDVMAIEGLSEARLPAFLQSLSYGQMQGTFNGDLEKFDTRLALRTDIGGIYVDIRSQDTLQGQRLFAGTVTADRLDVGILSGRTDWLGTVDAELSLSALGARYDEMQYGLDGHLANLTLKGRVVDTVLLDGQIRKNYFHGSVTGTDPNLDFCFDGLLDYERAEPVSQYRLDISKIDLQAWGMVADEQPFVVSGQVSTDYVGRGLDDILGNLRLRAVSVERHGRSFYLPSLSLATEATDSLYKATAVTSDLLNLQLSGRYTLARFPSLYKEMLWDYIPVPFRSADETRMSAENEPQVFDLDLTLGTYRHDGQVYGINRLLELFVPAVQLDEYTRLQAHCDLPAHNFSIDLDSRYIGFKNILCTDGRVRIATEAPAHTRLSAAVGASAIYLDDSLSLNNFEAALISDGHDSLVGHLAWWNPSDSSDRLRSSGYVAATADMSDTNRLHLRFDSSYFVFSGQPWRIYPAASVSWLKDETVFHDIGLYALEDKESVLLSGRWAADTAARLDLTFQSFDMGYLSPLTHQVGMDIAGCIDGRLQVRDPKNGFDLRSDIRLRTLRLNGGDYGNGLLTAAFNRETRRIDGRLTVGQDTLPKPLLAIAGYYDLKTGQLDFDGRMSRLPAHFLSGYFRSFAADLTGELSGALRLFGPIRQMKWSLSAESDNLAMTVKALQSRYQFTRLALHMTEREIRFQDGRLQDVRYGRSGRLSGSVKHHYFKDMNLNLRVDADRLLVLNIQPGKDQIYSGRVFATGLVHISGPTNTLYIGVKAKTEPDSHIDFDFSSGTGPSAGNFVRFENEAPVEMDALQAFYVRRRQKEKSRGRLTVDLGLEINPDLTVGLDIRNATINGVLSAAGDGNMRLLIDPSGTQLFGTYHIQNGLFDFSMMDLLNKRFKLKEGGSIVWTGPMTDARVNIEAVYTTRTSLYPVLAAVGTSMIDESNLRKKVTVESIIALDGNLLNPDIHFDINLTNVEEDLKDLFFSYVNKENEDEMIRQTFSLLMLNSFMATGNADQGGLLSGSNALASSSELLFNQFNNFLSRLTTNFNVGMNYTPASEMNESEFQVMLSGQLFDDRLSIDGNIGVSEMEAKAASSVVGDINIEWKFTEQLRLKAFNRSNEKSLAQPDNSYTQGLGVIFRRDFNTGKEFFSRIGPTKEERRKQREARKSRKQAEKNQEDREINRP